MTKLAVFDCDGTLVDGQAAICAAMEQAFTAADAAPPPRNAIRRIVGLSLPQAVRRLASGIGEADCAAIVENYRHAYRSTRESGALHEPLFDGIAALLDALRSEGWVLAVATGKSDRGLAACLEANDIADLFASLHTADGYPSKPYPAMLEAALFDAGAAPQQAVMIGDTTFDVAMARAAGVRALGVAWGYHAPHELLAEGAEAVAGSPAELLEMLR